MLQGKVYVDSVWSSDLSFDVPFEHEEGEGGNSKGGYAQVHIERATRSLAFS